MTGQRRVLTLAAVSFLTAFGSVAVIASPGDGGSIAQQTVNLGLRGTYFVPNQGQWSDDGVVFGMRSRGVDVAFRESVLTMHIRENDSNDTDLTLGVSFPGSNEVTPVGGQPQAAKFNYFVGGDGRSEASNVPSYGEVVYENLYDGIDLHVRGSDSGVLKYEFHCVPGADYGQIRVAYDGIESLCVDGDGNLHIDTAAGTLSDAAPTAWQVGGAGETIASHFELIDAHVYRIVLVGPVDSTREVVIDPDIEWMYYLGGSDEDVGYDVAVGSDGSMFGTGYTRSFDFAHRINFQHIPNDAFLLKGSSSGELLWMTYLGGSGYDIGRDLAIDALGNAIVTGQTDSEDFEGHINSFFGGQDDGFVAKVMPSGELAWMTYVGGTGYDQGRGVAVDSRDEIFVSGATGSTEFSGHQNSYNGGFLDAFLCAISPNGQIDWMNYYGGNDQDEGGAVTVDRFDNALVTGNTFSSDFVGRNNSHSVWGRDMFVLKVDPNRQLDWMTYLGGSEWEVGLDIAATEEGDSVVAGWSESTDFVGRMNSHHGGDTDAVLVKVDSFGHLDWMRYFGGEDGDNANGVAVNDDGSIVLVGTTSSHNFEGRINSTHGRSDAYALKTTPAGRVLWMTYLGGRRYDTGEGIALSGSASGLLVGTTDSFAFSGQSNTYHGGPEDAFIVKIDLGQDLALDISASCPGGGPTEVSWSGATGGAQIALLYAREVGMFDVPNGVPCAGTALGLSNDHLLVAYRGSAGADGSRTLNANAGPGVCGGYLQLLDLSTCTTSNVAQIE